MSKKCRRSKNIVSADVGLVKDVVWKKSLQDRDTVLICSIRKSLIKKIPGLTEEFNKQSRYFGYWQGTEKDKAYIYVQKKNLVVDLHIDPSYVSELEKEGFVIEQRDNFQSQAGWLTGWKVPHSTTDIDLVVD